MDGCAAFTCGGQQHSKCRKMLRNKQHSVNIQRRGMNTRFHSGEKVFRQSEELTFWSCAVFDRTVKKRQRRWWESAGIRADHLSDQDTDW